MLLDAAPNKNVPQLVEALRSIECHLDLVGVHVPGDQAQLKAGGVSCTYRWILLAKEILRAYQEAGSSPSSRRTRASGCPA